MKADILPMLRKCGGSCRLFANAFQVEVFYLLAGPWSSTQKFEAGLNTGVLIKAIDTNPFIHYLPTIVRNKMIEDQLKRYTM